MSLTPAGEIVITGVGVVSPIGIGRGPFWSALCQGQSGIRQLPDRLGKVAGLTVGGTLESFEAKSYVRPRKALKVMSREIQTAFSAGSLAQEDAGLVPDRLDCERIATVFGSEMMSGDPIEIEDALRECGVREAEPRAAEFGEAAMKHMYPLWMLKYLPNMAACHVGISLGALGANNTIVSGDTSALAALAEGVSLLQRDIADCVFTGAAGTRLSPTRLACRGLQAPGTPRDPLSSSSRPFAHDRDGVIGGEGAAVLVMEQSAVARHRGAEPLAKVRGSAVRFIPTGNQLSKLVDPIQITVEAALAKAGTSAAQIGAVVSHGMGSQPIDHAEATALARVFKVVPPTVAPIAALGHCGAGMGALALVVGALILAENQIPPTVNASAKDKACLVNLLTQTAELTGDAVLVLSHTAEGHVVACILGR